MSGWVEGLLLSTDAMVSVVWFSSLIEMTIHQEFGRFGSKFEPQNQPDALKLKRRIGIDEIYAPLCSDQATIHL